MTDIVERLRAIMDPNYTRVERLRAIMEPDYTRELCREAADEIERLRKAGYGGLHYDLAEAQRQEIERLRAALEIIAGRRQCLDNLMGNVDVACAALDGKP